MKIPTPAEQQIIIDLLRQGLADGHRPLLTVISGSMRPLLRIGDQVQIESVPPEQLETGDIVVISLPETLLTHRLLRVEKGRLITQGDWSTQPDPPLDSRFLLGRVIGRQRDGRLADLHTSERGQKSAYLGRLAGKRNQLTQQLPRFFQRPVRALFLIYATIWCKINI